MVISKADHQRISAAIEAAEADSSGEIVCVLAQSSSDFGRVPMVWAALLALCLPWGLVMLTHWPVVNILLAQACFYALLYLVFSVPAVAIHLVPRQLLRASAHRAAMEQFMVRSVSRTRERTGILIFVSLAERYARIIADDGIASKLAQEAWQGIVDNLTAHMRRGDVTEGFLAAISACGEPLKAHFPARADDRNELPDRLYLI